MSSSPRFIHLRLHSEYSLLEGAVRLKKLPGLCTQAGMPAVLADNCGGCAMMSLMPADARVVAVEFKINFLAPAVGDRLRAEARVIKAGRSLSVTEVDVYAVTGAATTLVARMQQTGMRRDPR